MKFLLGFVLILGLIPIDYASAGTPPVFTSAATASSTIPLVGQSISFNAPAADPQGFAVVYIYDYGDGVVDLLGTHTYTEAGAYTVTITAGNCIDSVATSIPISVKGFTNLWIQKQSIKVGAPGKEAWKAKLIYNADRTTQGIFNFAEDDFITSLSGIAGINVDPSQFKGSSPKFTFKSAKGLKPSISVVLNESTQTLSIAVKSATFLGAAPDVLSNLLQLGDSSFALNTALDSKGKFRATSGYRSAAFVVKKGAVKVKAAGKDSAKFALLLGDPAFQFPGASGANNARFRITNSAGVTVLDKDFSSITAFAKGKLKTGKDTASPPGTLKYDSAKGKMSVAIKKATLTGLLSAPQEHVRVDVILGDQTYRTHVTLFASKTGAYTTKLGKGMILLPGTKSAPFPSLPTVVTTNPAQGATNVARNQKITATFSETMDLTTITAASFTLQQGITPVAGAITFSGTTAIFTPAVELTPQAMYAATLTTAVKDAAGNAQARNYVWCFTTGATSDTTAPTVTSTVPVNAQSSVAINSKISAAFSEAMDPLTLNSSTFTLMQGSTSVAGTVTYAATGASASFNPSSGLTPSTTYTATVTTGATDAAGNALAANFIWSFTTTATADTTAPTVVSTIPVNSATGVSINTKITATFSEAMDPLTLNMGTFTLMQGVTAVPGAVTYASIGTTASFKPDANLTPGTTYTATVTTGAKDAAGKALAANFVWSFTTSAAADTTAPTVVSTIPVNSATGVAINTKITATFSEAMAPLTLTMSTFTLMQGATTVPGVVTYASIGTTATFKPDANLTPGTAYTATVTTGAKDLAGNALAANVVWTFTTGVTADSIAPNVISTNPTDQATNVAINRTVNATFDESMDPATINSASFKLDGPGPNPISGTVTYNAGSKIATFTASSDLAPGTQFTATITTAVKDLAGNALAVNKTWTFTTGTQRAIQPVALGTAASFGTFGGGAGMTNQGLFTVINGDITTTGASTTVTGFHDSVGDIYTETPLNKGQVNGRIYTAPPTPGGAGVGGNATTEAIAIQAASDANTAYNNLTPASIPGGTDPGAGQLGGLTLPPGVYQAAGGTFMITGSDLTLDAQGDSNAVWVFQMAASLTVGGPAAPRTVNMINGAQAKNVFWQVGSAATINGAGGGTMVGTIIASSGVTFSTAGNVILTTLNGRALGLNASTTLVNTIINVPAP